MVLSPSAGRSIIEAMPLWPVGSNPCLPADVKINDSAIQLVLIPNLFALDAPIVLSQVLQLFDKRIAVLDAGEWV